MLSMRSKSDSNNKTSRQLPPSLWHQQTRALAGTCANFLTSIGKHDTTRALPTSKVIAMTCKTNPLNFK